MLHIAGNTMASTLLSKAASHGTYDKIPFTYGYIATIVLADIPH